MGTISLDLDDELVNAIEELNQAVRQAARELIVMELYRLGKISSRAAELLGRERLGFIQRASHLGIPCLRLN